MSQSPVTATWLGHGSFLFHSPEGRRLIVDPFLANNPSCPAAFKTLDRADLILVTHGHFDHIDDTIRIARASGATVVGIFELCQWLARRGVEQVSPMNKGGAQTRAGIRVVMTHALHSSGYIDDGGITYLGEAAGYVVTFENGYTIYFAGDTAVFSDMALIGELYHPKVAFLPIGDHFTMGPGQAAKACDLLKVGHVVPMHYGTFPVLTGTPAALRTIVAPRGVTVLEMAPGETVELS